jgi:hypothetical protein
MSRLSLDMTKWQLRKTTRADLTAGKIFAENQIAPDRKIGRSGLFVIRISSFELRHFLCSAKRGLIFPRFEENFVPLKACSTLPPSHLRKLSRLRLLRQLPDGGLICGF